MRRISRIVVASAVILQVITSVAQAATLYQLDNNTISTALNASDGTESLDNWFANEFTAVPGANLITRIDFGVFTTTPGTVAQAVLYRITDPGGNPALGATRVYTQAFTPLVGDGTNAFLQSINLTTPFAFNVGDKFLVSVFIPNVIGAPPNDVYPFLLDTSTSGAGTFWDRSAPGTFNLDNLSQARLLTLGFVSGGFVPGPGHMFLRAFGVDVPEPSAVALAGMGALLLVAVQRRNKQK